MYMMLQMERITSLLKTYSLSIVSRLIAVYFLWALHVHVGFPPTESLTYTAAAYLALFVFFFLLPFAKRFKLGRFIEFEAKVEQVQADIKDVRSETRELISAVSSVVSSMSVSANQNINLTFPGLAEALETRKQLPDVLNESSDSTKERRDILAYLDADSLDANYALARLRMDLERELRRIIGQKADSKFSLGTYVGFMSAQRMFHHLVSVDPRYQNMASSFKYVLQVCNAAIHGEQIPENVANEAIVMGYRMLRKLNDEEVLMQ